MKWGNKYLFVFILFQIANLFFASQISVLLSRSYAHLLVAYTFSSAVFSILAYYLFLSQAAIFRVRDLAQRYRWVVASLLIIVLAIVTLGNFASSVIILPFFVILTDLLLGSLSAPLKFKYTLYSFGCCTTLPTLTWSIYYLIFKTSEHASARLLLMAMQLRCLLSFLLFIILIIASKYFRTCIQPLAFPRPLIHILLTSVIYYLPLLSISIFAASQFITFMPNLFPQLTFYFFVQLFLSIIIRFSDYIIRPASGFDQVYNFRSVSKASAVFVFITSGYLLVTFLSSNVMVVISLAISYLSLLSWIYVREANGFQPST